MSCQRQIVIPRMVERENNLFVKCGSRARDGRIAKTVPLSDAREKIVQRRSQLAGFCHIHSLARLGENPFSNFKMMRNDWKAARHRFEENDAEWFAGRGVNEDISGLKNGGHIPMR